MATRAGRRRSGAAPRSRFRPPTGYESAAEVLMKARTCLAIVLAAGEGTRMRSARPKVLHAIAGRSLLAMCSPPSPRPASPRPPSWSVPARTRSPPRRKRVLPDAADLRAARAARNRARGAGGRGRDRARRRRYPRRLRRHAADPAGRRSRGCARRWPTARPSPCSAFGRPIRPATAGWSSRATSSSPSARKPTRAPSERAIGALQRRH